MPDSTTMTAIKKMNEYNNQLKVCKRLKSKISKDDYDKLLQEIEKSGRKYLKNKAVTEEDLQNYFEDTRNLLGFYIQTHQDNPEKILRKLFGNRMKVLGELFSKTQEMYATFAPEDKLTASEQKYANVIEQTGRLKTQSETGKVINLFEEDPRAPYGALAGLITQKAVCMYAVITGIGSNKIDSKVFNKFKVYEMSAISINLPLGFSLKIHIYVGVTKNLGLSKLLNPKLITIVNELGSGRIN